MDFTKWIWFRFVEFCIFTPVAMLLAVALGFGPISCSGEDQKQSGSNVWAKIN